MKTIGIIGGLGPMATVYYLEQITRMTDAAKDQEHPRVFMLSQPDIPDRTAYILGESRKDPLPVMIQAARNLQELGADFITIPCITAHYFYEDLTKQLDIPVIHLPRCAAQDVAAEGIRKVGLLATAGTIRSRVLAREFEAAGVEVLVPDAVCLEQLMQIIYDQVKKGAPVHWESFQNVAVSLQERGAEKLILGCTELPLLKREMVSDEPGTTAAVRRILMQDCIDVLQVLARHAVLASEAPLKKEFTDIIYKCR